MLADIREEDKILVVVFLISRLDASLASEFNEMITELLNREQSHFVLDLANVDFIDSTALGLIIHWLKKVKAMDQGELQQPKRGFVLCGVGVKVRSLLQLTRMDRVFSIYPTQEEAVRDMLDGKV